MSGLRETHECHKIAESVLPTYRHIHQVSQWCASLIKQPWMRSVKHIPCTRCSCGTKYYVWHLRKWFDCKAEGSKREKP